MYAYNNFDTNAIDCFCNIQASKLFSDASVRITKGSLLLNIFSTGGLLIIFNFQHTLYVQTATEILFFWYLQITVKYFLSKIAYTNIKLLKCFFYQKYVVLLIAKKENENTYLIID